MYTNSKPINFIKLTLVTCCLLGTTVSAANKADKSTDKSQKKDPNIAALYACEKRCGDTRKITSYPGSGYQFQHFGGSQCSVACSKKYPGYTCMFGIDGKVALCRKKKSRNNKLTK